mmetsp:Transcript_2945/g.12005  ORF Transcript_2945/g.12005 Transcript_2945/m.12005 type:complete len:343 (-) Transcript_2945:546-1574(-)
MPCLRPPRLVHGPELGLVELANVCRRGNLPAAHGSQLCLRLKRRQVRQQGRAHLPRGHQRQPVRLPAPQQLGHGARPSRLVGEVESGAARGRPTGLCCACCRGRRRGRVTCRRRRRRRHHRHGRCCGGLLPALLRLHQTPRPLATPPAAASETGAATKRLRRAVLPRQALPPWSHHGRVPCRRLRPPCRHGRAQWPHRRPQAAPRLASGPAAGSGWPEGAGECGAGCAGWERGALAMSPAAVAAGSTVRSLPVAAVVLLPRRAAERTAQPGRLSAAQECRPQLGCPPGEGGRPGAALRTRLLARGQTAGQRAPVQASRWQPTRTAPQTRPSGTAPRPAADQS